MTTRNTVYLINGPLGVGKSSVSRELVKKVKNCSLVYGDSHLKSYKVGGMLWERRVEVAWKKIVEDCKRYLWEERDVVVDFVVEDELDWFIESLSGFPVTVRLVTLTAGESEIKIRLKKHGGLEELERALYLRKKFADDKERGALVIDTTYLSVLEVVDRILGRN